MKARFFNIHNIKFSALKEGTLRYSTLAQAQNELNSLKTQYITSRKSEPNKTSFIIFWIYNYELTEEEIEQGYIGNFAKIMIKMLANKLYTLVIEKFPEEVRCHPQKKRDTHHLHPNFGHPIIRSVKKGKKYQNEKDAQYQLERLHIEHPSTIPATRNKLYLMIYSKCDTPPIKKFILEVKYDGDKFFLNLTENPEQGKLSRYKFDEVLDTISSYLLPHCH